MKIAFVGKGGSGKTTYASLFSRYLADKNYTVAAIDADINMHMPIILGLSNGIDSDSHLSRPSVAADIRSYMIGKNTRIESVAKFKKSTPPAQGSQLIDLNDDDNFLFRNYATKLDGINLMVVGTYEEEDIGSSCYHNNLAILENILSHSYGDEAMLVCDMVAGIDAFSNTLHAQFDMLVLAVEPTTRGLEVYRQFHQLAAAAGTLEQLFVVGNKVVDDEDEKFIRASVQDNRYLGSLKLSKHLSRVDKGIERVSISQLEFENHTVLAAIEKQLLSLRPDHASNLTSLWKLHETYVSQASVRERFGNLMPQIDRDYLDEYASIATTKSH